MYEILQLMYILIRLIIFFLRPKNGTVVDIKNFSPNSLRNMRYRPKKKVFSSVINKFLRVWSVIFYYWFLQISVSVDVYKNKQAT